MTPRAPWNQDDQDAAFAEGWGIFENDGVFPEIQFTNDYPSPFRYDSEAVSHVMKRAGEGSALHRRAAAHLAEFWLNACRPPALDCREQQRQRCGCSG